MEQQPLQSWTLMNEAKPPADFLTLLMEGETILSSYRTFRDFAALTSRRILVRDEQGVTGRKYTAYSIPYTSILFWEVSNNGSFINETSTFVLYTQAGNFQISVQAAANGTTFEKNLTRCLLKD